MIIPVKRRDKGISVKIIKVMIYFVRHGETVWNVENKICGATDSPLTDLGHRQAVETAENIQSS